MPALMWFREDLRIRDNPALFAASQKSDAVIGLYLMDSEMWRKHHVAHCRIQFILCGLEELKKDLEKLNIPLLIVEIKKTKDIPSILYQLATKFEIDSLFFNRQYEVNEKNRDQTVIEYLTKNNIACYHFDDQTIFPPGSVLNQQGDCFKVFTAYKRAWYLRFTKTNMSLCSITRKQKPFDISVAPIPTLCEFPTNIDLMLWPSGEKKAHQKLQQFIDHQLFDYHKTRDFPAINGTSQLSPYLACGMVSARQCFMAAFHANNNELDSGNKGAITWMTELIWRDFYKHILVAVPRVSMHQPYQLDTVNIPWKYNNTHLQAWQQGQTGFPIIDAAMRQLNTIGWMHNRLRMITAMFLAKNLLLDWRLGEDYFMNHLIDGDLAANNGGWQWCASTGTDAAPYFRIFNPITQSERFDAKGDFIRHYCPELSAFDNKSIHDPHHRNPLLAQKVNYPKPIVELKKTRAHAIEVFKSIHR